MTLERLFNNGEDSGHLGGKMLPRDGKLGSRRSMSYSYSVIPVGFCKPMILRSLRLPLYLPRNLLILRRNANHSAKKRFGWRHFRKLGARRASLTVIVAGLISSS
jgi:hypothetical protein